MIHHRECTADHACKMELRVISTKDHPLGGPVTLVDFHLHRGIIYHLEDQDVIKL
jgi:hypothetical protein